MLTSIIACGKTQDHVTTIMITHDATEIAAADQLAKVIAGRLEVHA